MSPIDWAVLVQPNSSWTRARAWDGPSRSLLGQGKKEVKCALPLPTPRILDFFRISFSPDLLCHLFPFVFGARLGVFCWIFVWKRVSRHNGDNKDDKKLVSRSARTELQVTTVHLSFVVCLVVLYLLKLSEWARVECVVLSIWCSMMPLFLSKHALHVLKV